MKDILRRLLEAEEAGRREAAGLEAAGEALLRQAAVERDALVAEIESQTTREVDELTREMMARIADEREAINRRGTEAVQQLRTEAANQRLAAIDRVLGIVLGETAP
jgi:vacuolar-type H+-ATPase subunit H